MEFCKKAAPVLMWVRLKEINDYFLKLKVSPARNPHQRRESPSASGGELASKV